MSRIHNVVYSTARPDTNDSTNLAGGAITINDSQWAMVKVPFHSETRIGKIVVKQLSAGRGGGTSCNFTFAAYMIPVIPVSNSSAVAIPDTAPLYEVIPTKTATAGNAIRDFTPDVGGDGFLFKNFVGNDTNNERYLYVYIAPAASSGTTKWEFAFAAISDVGR